MKEINALHLDKYSSHALHPIKIVPSKNSRDMFMAKNGLPIYGDKSVELKVIEFDIEIKGTREEIEVSKSRLSNDIELCRLKLGDGRLYEGTFYINSVDKVYNGFEVVSCKGECIGYKDKLHNTKLSNGVNKIHLTNSIESPVVLEILGTGKNIFIKGLGDDINIPNLDRSLIIDGKEKTIKDTKGLNAFNDVDIFKFPRLLGSNIINISGTGNFEVIMTYRERVI